jgi:hypothetical protein
MKIRFLRAFNGDSIHIWFQDETGTNRNILIDGGSGKTYRYKNPVTGKLLSGDLEVTIDKIRGNGEKVDLLILTHVDSDHIGGILKWFEYDAHAADLIVNIWFNSGRLIFDTFNQKEITENLVPLRILDGTNTSIAQGATFEDFIERHDIWDKKLIKAGKSLTEFGVEFKFLSPNSDSLKLLLKKWEKEAPETLTASKNDYDKPLSLLLENDEFKEDDSIHNGSSIAFILTYNLKNLLFLGDAHPTPVSNCLRSFGYSEENPLKAELVKVSHHGSKFSTSVELLNLIDCQNFVISSNGDIHNLPDKQCLARIISAKSKVVFYFNYPEKINDIFLEQDSAEFEFSALSADQDFEI